MLCDADTVPLIHFVTSISGLNRIFIGFFSPNSPLIVASGLSCLAFHSFLVRQLKKQLFFPIHYRP